MKERDIIIMGGSAGSYSVIVKILSKLPKDYALPILVIIHRNAKYQTSIEDHLNQKFKIQIKMAQDKEHIQASVVYFAPPGYHLLIEPNHTFALDGSEQIQYSRPSIDVTFESVADVYGKHCHAILLSGANQDGSRGLAYVKHVGGTCIVQHPDLAEMAIMPLSAIHKEAYHYILEDDSILDYLLKLDDKHRHKKPLQTHIDPKKV